jgi:SAM-dependent methyltransferase
MLAQFPAAGLPPRLLSVGCGDCPEAATVQAALPGWAFFGLDLDGDALRRARHTAPALRLVQADARHLPGLLRARFGVILLRHPDLFQRRSAWRQIIHALPESLAPGGVLLITLYAPEETEFVRALLPAADPPDEGALAPPDLAGHDRFALLYRAPRP